MIATGPNIRAVGWLSVEYPFPKGDVPQQFIDRLELFCTKWDVISVALEWPASGGSHECEFCGKFRASGSIGIPAGEILFVAPDMIAHYVKQHSYQPPAEFISAVMDAPATGTLEFKNAVSKFVGSS